MGDKKLHFVIELSIQLKIRISWLSDCAVGHKTTTHKADMMYEALNNLFKNI